ncbi:MAG TPA: class I SAM-dependent methyltransferase [Candidatus Limnocylindrales bacterium]|jgi:ubiquinone/menaquinone biosynthesis C-methylase UbiE|nr:class I SAM-dependent methyltransferase [Candidatus Limnocylindrales bacterium]
MDRDDPAYRGQADYSRLLLKLYDPIVIGFVSWAVWRFPAEPLIETYRTNIRDRHLDIGPGTGYAIEHSGLPDGSRVTLVDPNRNVLRHASRRLRRLDVTAVEADVLKPLPIDGPFDSAALSLVIHCLPGPLTRKALAVKHVAAVLAPSAVLFGASVLGRSGQHTWLARRVLSAFNRRGAFDNLDDTEEGLREILEASFERVELETIGSIAIFSASSPRQGT